VPLNQNMHQVTTLSNGVRVATLTMPQTLGVSVGLWVGVGGRYEPARLSGVSHFIEHLLFKGTRRRTARDISVEVESVGGYLNAFTGEEMTCFYAKAAREHLERLADVLCDMYLHPAFAAEELEKERGVIREEILMYRDQPQQYVHELLNEIMFPNHPLGRALTGTVETVSAMSRADVARYKAENYIAANTVAAVAGRCFHDDVVELFEGKLSGLNTTRSAPRFLPMRDRQRRARIRVHKKDVEQTQIALGVHGCSRHHPDRYAVKLLSILLGENMSSRLFQVVREQHGLAYAIQSSAGFFADTGTFVISAGLDNKRLGKALRLIMRELRRATEKAPALRELENARNYALGQLKLSLESSTNQMMWLGEHLLSYGRVAEPSEVERGIKAVTAEDVRRVAAELFQPRRWSVAVVGNAQPQELKACLSGRAQ
jgi:predicted Zn-dependent peptidase